MNIVTWSETDASGSIHFTAPLRWVENAEHALLRAEGMIPGSFPRRAVSSSYLRSLREGDEYRVDLEVERIGSTSITYGWRVLSGGAVCVEGSHTVVHLDDTGVPSPVPESLRAGLAVRLRAKSDNDGGEYVR